MHMFGGLHMNDIDNLWGYIWEFRNKYGDELTIANFEGNILDIKNPHLCYRFAAYIKGANIDAHQKVVMEYKKPQLCLDFAEKVEGANIDALEKVVMQCKSLELRRRL